MHGKGARDAEQGEGTFIADLGSLPTPYLRILSGGSLAVSHMATAIAGPAGECLGYACRTWRTHPATTGTYAYCCRRQRTAMSRTSS